MNETTIIFIMELIGTIAFTISGALIAVRCGGTCNLFGNWYRNGMQFGRSGYGSLFNIYGSAYRNWRRHNTRYFGRQYTIRFKETYICVGIYNR